VLLEEVEVQKEDQQEVPEARKVPVVLSHSAECQGVLVAQEGQTEDHPCWAPARPLAALEASADASGAEQSTSTETRGGRCACVRWWWW